jgi:hypothetical protein
MSRASFCERRRTVCTHILLALAVDLLELAHPNAFGLEALKREPEPERRERVLYRVVSVARVGLDLLVEDEPGQEAEREPAVARLHEVNVDSVENVVRRDKDVWAHSQRHTKRRGWTH